MRLTRRHLIATAAACALPAGTLAAAPASALIKGPWRRFGSGGDPDDADWAAVLASHLTRGADGVARFDYARAPLGAVAGYVGRLEGVDPTRLAAPAAFAYWANLYNALTIRVVLEAWPVASIRRIGGSLFAPGPWREKRVRVAGRDLSLDDIEHGIMRPVFGDARVHYAVNCASIGCPDLLVEPWRGAGLSAALDAAARAYVNHPRGARVAGGRLTVSSIYRWFAADFGGTDAGVIAHLRAHADPRLADALAGVGRIDADDYDWAINAP
jgi:hypothetical protein